MTEIGRGSKRFNIIFALLMALVLWLYVVNVENPQGNTSISGVPVSISGAEILDERGLMVTDLSRESVSIKFSGKRKSFLRLYKIDLSLLLDVSSIETPGEHRVVGKLMPEAARSDQTLSMTERDGFSVTVTVAKKESREVPVRASFEGGAAEGYAVGTLRIPSETLTVQGPQQLLDQISHVQLSVQGEELRETVKRQEKIVLIDQEGKPLVSKNLILPSETMEVTVPVLTRYELPLKVTLKDGGGATAADAKVSISPATAVIYGGDELLAGKSELVIGEIDLAEVFSSKNEHFAIPLPEGAENASGSNEASVSVQIDLPMKSFSVTQIQLQNHPRGFQVLPQSESIQVWVRGKQEELDKLSAQNLRVDIDLATAQLTRGLQRLDATIFLDNGEGCGVVGRDYALAVELR